MGTCENCKYSEPIMGGLACMGQKGMPFVRPTDSCDNWKTMKQTNADRIRAMTDEELAKFVCNITSCEECRKHKVGICINEGDNWLDWLKREVNE